MNKNVLLICLLLCAYVQISFAQVTVFPYNQDFESGAGGWTAMNGADTEGWELGTPASTLIRTAHSGTRAWKTNLNGNYSTTANLYLVSPEFDFSSLTSDPYIYFYMNYDIHPGDFGFLEFSTDGTTWNLLGNSGSGVNWYNDAGGWTYVNGHFIRWLPAAYKLTGLAGQPSVFFRFRLTAVASSTSGQGIAIDDVSIKLNGPDLAVANMVLPSATELGSSEEIIVTVENTSMSTLTETDLAVHLTVTADYTTFLTREAILAGLSLMPGERVEVEFDGLDLSSPNIYEIHAEVVGPNDPIDFNNTADRTLFQKTINSFPHLQDFETNIGGWHSFHEVYNFPPNESGRWQYGTPAGTTINGAHSGTKAWTTNLNGQYALDGNFYLYSPRYDLSAFTEDPYLGVYLNYDINLDNAVLFAEYSKDGVGWTMLGDVGTGYNWYDFTGASPGNSGGWIFAAHELTGLAGESSVVLRLTLVAYSGGSHVRAEGGAIDDVIIGSLTADAGVDQVACNVTTVNLSATQPLFGTGTWTIAGGNGGTIADPSSRQTTFTGIPGETYLLEWTVSVGGAIPDQVDETIIRFITTSALAGTDQSVCGTAVLLSANTPTAGATGSWEIVSGVGGTIVEPSNPGSEFRGTGGTTYVLRWTLNSQGCQASDEVSITLFPVANAGSDVASCNSSINLAANLPGAGDGGVWSVQSGAGGTITSPADPTSGFSGVAGTTYVLRWTMDTQGCQTSDEVVINLLPAVNAGSDQVSCSSAVNLAANLPDPSGSGLWSIESGGGGTVVTPLSAASVFSGVPGTTYILKWTVNTPSCQSSDEVSITLLTSPVKPTITVQGANTTSVSLVASAVAGTHQWFLNGQPVGGTGQTLPISETGVYTVQTTVQGCTSSLSDPFTVTADVITGIDVAIIDVSAYPNPFESKLMINFNSSAGTWKKVTLRSLHGVVVNREQTSESSLTLETSGIQKGLYILSIDDGSRRPVYLKVIKSD